MREVNHINGDVVLLKSHAQILKVFLSSRKRRAYKYYDPLSLGFVLSVLQGQLSDLDGLQ